MFGYGSSVWLCRGLQSAWPGSQKLLEGMARCQEMKGEGCSQIQLVVTSGMGLLLGMRLSLI